MGFKQNIKGMFTRFFRRDANTIVHSMNNAKSSASKITKGEQLLYTSLRNRAFPAGYKTPSIPHEKTIVGGGLRQLNQVRRSIISNPVSTTAHFAVGAAGMASIAVMNGAIGKMDQIMAQRYMRDSRYSSQMLANSNVGRSVGNGSMNIGNHVGLSLSLSRGRHG